MKGKAVLAALCLLSLLHLSCTERLNPDSSGVSSVIFSVSSGFVSDTKTQYAGGYVADGQKERIEWLAGDGLTILSPQAIIIDKTTRPWTVSYSSSSPEFSVADYQISKNGTASGVYSVSGIVPTNKADDLHWGVGAHHFFGVYPMLSSLPADIQSRVGITTNADRTKGIISAYIPKAQTYSSQKAAGKSKRNSQMDSTHVFPQMQYAWMWSAQYSSKPDVDVDMYFSPMITTFQIAVQGIGEKDLPITRFELHSEDDALQGAFTATVSVKDNNSVVTRSKLSNMIIEYDNADYSRQANVNDVVSFTMPEGIAVNGKKKVTFTVFVYPKANLGAGYFSGLTVRFVSPGITYSLKLKDASSGWVQFPAGCKINIDGLTLPEQLDPWHFSVTSGDFTQEASDVVISPVKVTEFRSQEGGNLDEME